MPTSPATSNEVETIEATDGDSLRATISGIEERVRVLGINAPEMDECMGEAARERLTTLVQEATDIRIDGTDRDRYGRILAWVTLDDRDLSLIMVEEGMALAMSDGRPDLVEAEATALELELGMWSPQACGRGPIPHITVSATMSDPPGPDGDRLDEEWVEFVTDDEVDVSGWTLRDESSSHRLTFPEGTRLESNTPFRVVTGCRPPRRGLAWCASGPIWNNDGDSVILLDADGRVVAHHRIEPADGAGS